MKTLPVALLIRLVLLVMLITSCTRKEDDLASQNCPGDCTVIKGRFTTAGKAEGLANIPLEVIWENTKYTGIGKSGTFRRKATGHTDADGYYEIKFLMRDDELGAGYFRVQYRVDAKQYCFPLESGFSLDLKRDTTVTTDFLIPRKAFVELQVADREKIPESAYFTSSFSFDYGMITDRGVFQQYGVIVDLKTHPQPIVEVAGDQPTIIQTIKTKDNIQTVQYDTLRIAAGGKYIFTPKF